MISARTWVCASLVGGLTVGCAADEKPYVKREPDEALDPVPCYVVQDKPVQKTFRLGVGFTATEARIFEAAIKRWNKPTGFSMNLELEPDDKMLAEVHVLARTPVCWDPGDLNTFGCWRTSDLIVFNRDALMDIATRIRDDAGDHAPPLHEIYQTQFYITALHDLGHYLGLKDAEPGVTSIMQRSAKDAFFGPLAVPKLHPHDVKEACHLHTCRFDWCVPFKGKATQLEFL
jgi:hypothetical protein